MRSSFAAALAVLAACSMAACAPHRTILDPPAGGTAALPKAGPIQLEVLRHEAESWLGTPYRLGGDGRQGIDCSAYVRKVYSVLSVELPRTVDELYTVGAPLDASKLRLGDLVFFRFKGRDASHVGIYLGEGLFIHASFRDGVRVDALSEPAYAENFVGCRRVMA